MDHQNPSNPKPKALEINGSGIPDYLKQFLQFVLWRFEEKRGSWTKVPYQQNGRRAASDKPDTWCSFEEAHTAYGSGRFDGIGFCLNPGDGLACLDLDHCIDANGFLAPWSLEIISRFPGTYIELSPSGSGIHIWTLGTPRDRKLSKRWNKPGTTTKEGVDLLDSSHNCYLILTGRAPTSIKPSSEILNCQPSLDVYRNSHHKPQAVKVARSSGPIYSVEGRCGDVDLERLRDALTFVPGGDYDRWVAISMALKASGVPFYIFHEWSCHQPGYIDEDDCARKWERDLTPNGSKKIGSVFHVARKNGWQPKHSYGVRQVSLDGFEDVLGGAKR